MTRTIKHHLLLPNKQLYDIAIGIADIHLENTITARTWPAYYCDITLLQVLASFFQVSDLKGKMRSMANGEFIRTISPGLYLGNTSRLIFANQMYFRTPLTKPGAREGKIARSGYFLHAEHLAVKTP